MQHRNIKYYFTRIYLFLRWQLRMFILWLDFRKRFKFKKALKKYAVQIDEWERTHDEPPPIVWYEPDKDYIWVTRDMRINFRNRIRKAMKNGK